MENDFVLSQNDIHNLKEARKNKKKGETDRRIKWTLDDDSYILIAASRILIDIFIERNGDGYHISLQCLINWEDDKIVCKDIQKFEDFKARKLKESSQSDFSSILLDCRDIDYLLDEKIILAKTTYKNSLRLCTDPNYKKYQKTKQFDKDTVWAYCEVLGFDFQNLESNLCTNLSRQNNDSETLYQTLVSFNYNNIVQYITSINASREGILYIPPVSNLYETWLLRRLERFLQEQSDLVNVRKISYDLTDPNTRLDSIDDFIFDLGSRLRAPIYKLLKTENLVIIFKNIENYDQGFLNELIVRCWSHLTNNRGDGNGFLLMVWLDRGKRSERNDWQDQLSRWPNVFQLTTSSNFVRTDFENIFEKLNTRFRSWRLGENRDGEINQLWEQSQQGQIDKTLEAFYRRFNCKLASEPRWHSYP